MLGSSPRWRGRPRISGVRLGPAGLIPALAGTTRRQAPGLPGSGAHPRAGGDDPCHRRRSDPSAGSSPRWRGRPLATHADTREEGLIPALAGTTLRASRPVGPSRAHPRAGGDDQWIHVDAYAVVGSSPRWRGRPGLLPLKRLVVGLIPALAGTTLMPAASRPSPRAHPRAGGDDSGAPWTGQASRGSSPRWRGRLRRRSAAHHAAGLIPALAGTTWLPSAPIWGRRAQPRAGGDDRSCLERVSVAAGSSPRWRGRPGEAGRVERSPGSSPRWRGRLRGNQPQ